MPELPQFDGEQIIVYYETFISHIEETPITYYKFISPLGDTYYCSKVVNNKEVQINNDEYDHTKFRIDQQMLKFILFQFLNHYNTILTVDKSKTITFSSVSVTDESVFVPNMIFYSDSISEYKITEFEIKTVERFMRFIFKNKLTEELIQTYLSMNGELLFGRSSEFEHELQNK